MTFNELTKKFLLLEILKGMALTLKMLFSHAVTRQYPEEKRPVQPGFRGLHALPRRPDGTARCVGCGLCAAVCPSKCIKVYTSEGPDNTKIVDRYEVEVLRCIYCGLCYEACPYMAIMLSENYEYSVYSRQDLFMTKEKLMENWDAYMAGDKDYEFYTKFWRPKTEDFTGSENQAVFKGRR